MVGRASRHIWRRSSRMRLGKRGNVEGVVVVVVVVVVMVVCDRVSLD